MRTLLAISIAYATVAGATPTIDVAVRSSIAKMLGVEVNDAAVDRVLASDGDKVRMDPNELGSELGPTLFPESPSLAEQFISQLTNPESVVMPPAPPPGAVPVIAHLRSGGGSLLPTGEFLAARREAQATELAARSAPLSPEEFEHQAHELMGRFERAPELPRCTRDRTERAAIPEAGNAFVDVIVLATAIPLNADELFGKATSILRYSTAPNDHESIAVGLAGVPCLPYRTRIVNGVEYRHYGGAALRNYDDAPEGPGKLHPLVARRLTEGEL